MRISDWSSDVCSSDLLHQRDAASRRRRAGRRGIGVNGPLRGIRVLEIGHMLAGPYCGLLLADLGAEVIKIEPPTGDIAREASPPFVGEPTAYFATLNPNKIGKASCRARVCQYV